MNKNYEMKATEKKVVKKRNVDECKIDRDNKQIILTRKFAKEAASFGSKACKKLMDAQKSFPKFDVVLRTAKPSEKRAAVKGLTISFMENHIAVRFGKNSTEYKDFLSQRKLSMAYKNPYIFVRNWFTENIPDWNGIKSPSAAAYDVVDEESIDNNVVA